MSSESNTNKNEEAGLKPDEVYKFKLNKFRYKCRKFIIASLRRESELMTKFQLNFRSSFLDKYMLYSSFLGSVTFFILLLPIPYFWGFPEQGSVLLQTLAASVWITCLMKDFCCVPRPYSPPVTRITTGSSHLEYGFPSTHSTTAVAQALVLKQWLDSAISNQSISNTVADILHMILVIVTASVVIGRFYCGMHSSVDCIGGALTGGLIYLIRSKAGIYYTEYISNSSWLTPIILTITCLLMVHAHVEPVEDNPAFEDSVAFISVFLGCGIGEWFSNKYNIKIGTFFIKNLSGFKWYLASLAKYPIGVGLIFLTRMICKPIMHTILPPLFRLILKVYELPNRQGYVPATQYEEYIPSREALSPIPSVVDLTELTQLENKPNESDLNEIGHRLTINKNTNKEFSPRHYDADVMTRVVTYASMGFVGTILAPIIFEYIGWGL